MASPTSTVAGVQGISSHQDPVVEALDQHQTAARLKHLHALKEGLESTQTWLQSAPSQLHHHSMIPLGKHGFARGRVVHTNEVLCPLHVDGLEQTPGPPSTPKAGSSSITGSVTPPVYVWKAAGQAAALAGRHLEVVQRLISNTAAGALRGVDVHAIVESHQRAGLLHALSAVKATEDPNVATVVVDGEQLSYITEYEEAGSAGSNKAPKPSRKAAASSRPTAAVNKTPPVAVSSSTPLSYPSEAALSISAAVGLGSSSAVTPSSAPTVPLSAAHVKLAEYQSKLASMPPGFDEFSEAAVDVFRSSSRPAGSRSGGSSAQPSARSTSTKSSVGASTAPAVPGTVQPSASARLSASAAGIASAPSPTVTHARVSTEPASSALVPSTTAAVTAPAAPLNTTQAASKRSVRFTGEDAVREFDKRAAPYHVATSESEPASVILPARAPAKELKHSTGPDHAFTGRIVERVAPRVGGAPPAGSIVLRGSTGTAAAASCPVVFGPVAPPAPVAEVPPQPRMSKFKRRMAIARGEEVDDEDDSDF